jgi:hypothetical protein
VVRGGNHAHISLERRKSLTPAEDRVMGIFDAQTVGIYRYAPDGRRIFSFGLFPRHQYLVPDEAMQPLELQVRRYFQLMMALIVLASVVTTELHVRWL